MLYFHGLEVSNSRICTAAHLFGTSIIKRREAIALTQNGGIFAAPNGIHSPLGVVIVQHMEITESAPAQLQKDLCFSKFSIQSPTLRCSLRGR